MYRILFASDCVLPSNLASDNIWTAENSSLARSNAISEFKSSLGPFNDFVLNVEGPILIDGGTKKTLKNGPSLKQHSEYLNLLNQLDVTIAALANNHIGDYGVQGVSDTLRSLSNMGIKTIGAGLNEASVTKSQIIRLPDECIKSELVILNYAEDEFGSFSDQSLGGYNQICYRQALKDYRRFHLGEDNKYSVAIIHGGAEFCPVPSPSLRKFAHFLADLGVDLILCQHTHVVGIREVTQNSTIIYGQGNFIFPSPDRPEAGSFWDEGLVVALEMDGVGVNINYFKTTHNLDSFIKLEQEMVEHDANHQAFFDPKYLETGYNQAWLEWCNRNERRYANVFFNYGIFRRVINRITAKSFEIRNKKILKIINYVRTASHSDVFKSLVQDRIDHVDREDQNDRTCL